LLGSSFLGAPQGARLHLVALAGVLLLTHARIDCALGRREWLRIGLVVLFVKLDDLDGRLEDENEVVEDLRRKRCPKSVGSSVAVLTRKMWKKRG
jgi:hypothetical protein